MKPELRAVPSELPDPPYPADSRAKGIKFELDLERIHQSRTWILAPPDMRPWLLMVWTESWRSVPVGSYENDDELIAARIGMSHALFQTHRSILMRGWYLASDDRLYHPVIAEIVQHVQNWRKYERDRKRKYREQKDDLSHGTDAGQTGDSVGLSPSSPSPSPSPSPKERVDAKAPKRFVKPTLADVQMFCRGQRLTNVDPVVFFDHYETNGWKVGKNGMKDWKAALRNWNRRETNGNAKPNPQPRPKRQVW